MDGEDEDREEDESEDKPEKEDAADGIKEILNFPRFPCMAHSLQLAVRELTKIQAYNNLIANAKDLVKYVKISSVANEKLRASCVGKVLSRNVPQ